MRRTQHKVRVNKQPEWRAERLRLAGSVNGVPTYRGITTIAKAENWAGSFHTCFEVEQRHSPVQINFEWLKSYHRLYIPVVKYFFSYSLIMSNSTK